MTLIKDQLKLELETTTTPNLLDNHSGEIGTADWLRISTAALTGFTSSTDAVPNIENGTTFKVAVGLVTVQTRPVAVTAGKYIGMQCTHYQVSGSNTGQVSYRFYDANGKYISNIFLGGGMFPTVGVADVYTPVGVPVPAGAVTASMRIAFNGTGVTHVSRFMLATDTTAALASKAFVASTWTDIIGTSNRLVIDRGNSLDGISETIQPGVLNARVLGSTYDPSVNSEVRPNRRVRVRALRSTGWKFLFRGAIDTLNVDYDQKGRSDIELVAIDPGKRVATTSMPLFGTTAFPLETGMWRLACMSQVALDTDLILETANADTSGPLSREDSAKAANWIQRAALTFGRYAWVTKTGQLAMFPRASLGTSAVVTFSDTKTDATAVWYTGIGINFGSEALVNGLTVTRINLDETENDGAKEYGPYVVPQSVADWGAQNTTAEIIAGSPSAVANDQLPIFGTPKRFPREVKFNAQQHLDAAIDLDIYDAARVKRTTILDDIFRVLRLRHEITASVRPEDETWVVTAEFRPLESPTAVTVVVPAAGADTGPADIVLPTPGPLGSRRRNSTFAVAHNTWTTVPLAQAITLDQVTWDATNNRFTVPKDGRYVLSAGFRFAANATGTRGVRIVVSGSSIGIFASGVGTNGDGGGTLAKVHKLAAGDTVQTQVYQSSGGSLNIDGANDATFLDVTYIGA